MPRPLVQKIAVEYSGTQEARRDIADYSRSSRRQVEKTSRTFKQESQSMASSVKGAFQIIYAYIGVQFARMASRIVGDFRKIIQSTEETQSKFETTFGAATEGAQAFVDEYSNILGLTGRQGQEFLAQAGAIVQGMGAAKEASADFGEEAVRLAGDLASFNNVGIDEAFTAIRSGITGESEPLKRFGVILRADAVALRALAESGKQSKDELTELEKTQARLLIIQEKMGVQVGDLERTQGSRANTERRLTAEIREQYELTANQLIPAYDDVLLYLRQIIGANEEAATSFRDGFTGSVNEGVGRLVELIDALRALWVGIQRVQGSVGEALEIDGWFSFGSVVDKISTGLMGAGLLLDEVAIKVNQAVRAAVEADAAMADFIGYGGDKYQSAARDHVARINERIAAIREEQNETMRLRREREKAREGLANAENLRSFTQEMVRQAYGGGLPGAGADDDDTSELTDEERAALEAATEALAAYREQQRLAAASTSEVKEALEEMYAAAADVKELEGAAGAGADTGGDLEAARERLRVAKERVEQEEELWASMQKTAGLMGKVDPAALRGAFQVPERLQPGSPGGIQEVLRRFNDQMRSLRTEMQATGMSAEEFGRRSAKASEGFLQALRDLYRRMKAAGDLSPAVEKAFEEAFGAAEDGAKGAGEEAGKLAENLQNFGTALRAVERLGDVFGGLSDGMQDFVGGLADGIDGMGRLLELRDAAEATNEAGDNAGTFGALFGTASGALSAAVPALGAAAGLASMLGGLFSGNDEAERRRQEQMEKLRDELADNARAVRENTNALFEEARVGSGISADDLERAQQIMADIARGRGDTSRLAGEFGDLTGIDLGSITGPLEESLREITGYSDAGEMVRTRQLSALVGEDFGDRLDETDIARIIGTVLTTEDEAQRENILALLGLEGLDLTAIKELGNLPDDLAERLGMFGESVAGASERMRFLQENGLATAAEAFQSFADHLLSLDLTEAIGGSDLGGAGIEGGASLRDILQEARGLDLSSESGRSRLEELQQAIAAAIAEGAFDYGALTPDELNRILDVFGEDFAAEAGEASGTSDTRRYQTTAQVQSTITEQQTNVLLDYFRALLQAEQSALSVQRQQLASLNALVDQALGAATAPAMQAAAMQSAPGAPQVMTGSEGAGAGGLSPEGTTNINFYGITDYDELMRRLADELKRPSTNA